MKWYSRILMVVLLVLLAACARPQYQERSASGYLWLLKDGEGTTQFSVSDDGDVYVGSTINYGTNNLYALGYGTASYAVDLSTDTVTTTLELSLTNVTTPTVGVCTLAEDVDATEAICSLSISGTTATLKLWDAAGTSAGTTGTLVHWMIIGQE